MSKRLCGKICVPSTESTNTSECRNADKTVTNNLANFNLYPKTYWMKKRLNIENSRDLQTKRGEEEKSVK